MSYDWSVDAIRRDLGRFGRKRGGEVATLCILIRGNLELAASRPEDVALRQLVAAQVERLAKALHGQ